MTIPNAMTPEEWASPDREILGAVDVELLSFEDRHRNAAMCLEGHPLGFTRKEMLALTDLLGVIDTDDIEDIVALSRRALAKIAALLPAPK